MKRIIFISALLITASLAFAQVNFGIKAGYTSSLGLDNYNSIRSGDYNLENVNSEKDNGFHAGVFARFNFSKMYFQPELLYAMGKKDYTLTYNDVSGNSNLTYDKLVTISTVDVPLLLGYKLLDLKAMNIHVFAGPKLRFNAGSSLEFSNLASGNASITTADLQKDIKAAQIGLEAGLGFDVLMFTVDARYNLIGDMYQTKLADLTIDNIPANTFVISLGWKLY